MRVADRVTDVTDRVQTRRLESKRESLGKDNDRLRTELRSTRDQLERERRARDELLDALKKGEGTVKADKVKVKTKKRGGFLRLLIVGGGAYVLGTRAGRERYEQIKTWASDMKGRVGSGGDTDEWSAMSNGGSTGMSGASGMSGSTGTQTGTGSTSTGSTSTGSTGSTSSGSTGSTSTTGSGSTPGSSSSGGGAGTGSSGTGSTSGSASTPKRSGSSGSTSGS